MKQRDVRKPSTLTHGCTILESHIRTNHVGTIVGCHYSNIVADQLINT